MRLIRRSMEHDAGRDSRTDDVRVEVVDRLFFWISLAQCVGLSAEDMCSLYLQKLDVNHKRQDDEYSMTAKNEADNKAITLDKSAK